MKQLSFKKSEWEEFLNEIDFKDDELKIIPLVRRGWAQEDIASELFISRRTVARRITSISNKIIQYILSTYKK